MEIVKTNALALNRKERRNTPRLQNNKKLTPGRRRVHGQSLWK